MGHPRWFCEGATRPSSEVGRDHLLKMHAPNPLGHATNVQPSFPRALSCCSRFVRGAPISPPIPATLYSTAPAAWTVGVDRYGLIADQLSMIAMTARRP